MCAYGNQFVFSRDNVVVAVEENRGICVCGLEARYRSHGKERLCTL